jgi:predicted nucleic acid-binding protein
MNYFSGQGESLRRTGAANVRAILANSQIETIFIERADFLSGFDLYEARPDKSYSLTDCISMSIMREHSIADVLTHDAHFTQEGIHILL